MKLGCVDACIVARADFPLVVHSLEVSSFPGARRVGRGLSSTRYEKIRRRASRRITRFRRIKILWIFIVRALPLRPELGFACRASFQTFLYIHRICSAVIPCLVQTGLRSSFGAAILKGRGGGRGGGREVVDRLTDSLISGGSHLAAGRRQADRLVR